ncbi:Hypothetical predicted protein [Xyrichtys novacula]|uniref:Uncharacterized protein n=1 Tax=Xyrichtys novacula TaxID=13765 RepID=A0AAV1F9S6_XYRNO|nr:Hypothetical predicted protein [Xyrichtys novacula]
MALFLLSLVMPSAVYALQRDCTSKPLDLTTKGMHLAFQLLLLQSLTGLSYTTVRDDNDSTAAVAKNTTAQDNNKSVNKTERWLMGDFSMAL